MMDRGVKIYVAGHTGLVGAAVVRRLKDEGYKNLLVRTRQELDLTRQNEVERFFKEERPEYVILSAARVGGIQANISSPAQFIYENLSIQSNVIHSAYLYGAKKLLFFCSACSYPRECAQPMKEKYLLSGYLEPTNEPYAIAKIAGIEMCGAYDRQYGTNFICAVPANIYGPNDNFDPDGSHVIPALIRKFHEAGITGEDAVTIWGTGSPEREFLYVDDVADAALFLMEHYNDSEIINAGTGKAVSIKELAHIIKEKTDYRGGVVFDASKPDGMPKKVLDISKITALGWHAKTSLKEGIGKTYKWYINQL